MGSAKSKENLNLQYIKDVVSGVMGEELWNGFYDVVTTQRPRLDIYDDNNKIVVLGEIPGILNPSDVTISVSENKLTIKGIAKDKYQQNMPGKRIKSECLYGAFDRTIELPYFIDEKSIKAVYENGLLEITMQRMDTKVDKRSVEVEFRK